MWAPQRKVQCVVWLAELKSVTRVQRRARREWNEDPPTGKCIYEWDKTLRETGSLISHAGKHPKQHVTEETVDRVCESFSWSPRKSIRQASRELEVPRSTVHNIVHKRLRLRAYKLQHLHHIKPDDQRKRTDFTGEMLSRIKENDSYLDLMLFSDESTFHVCGKINRRNCRIWGSGNPHQLNEYERHAPKLNVWLGLHKHGVIDPFFFMESTVTGHSCLDMLENFVVPQITPGFIFQQDGAPPNPQRCYHISG
jgi:hypothetical protein